MKGYVYLFKVANTNYVKIGMTKNENPLVRFEAMKTYCPQGVEVVCLIPTEKPAMLERELHRIYAPFRMSGEFFNLDDAKIQLIKNKYLSQKVRDAIAKAIYMITSENSEDAIDAVMESFRKKERIETINEKSGEIIDYIKSNLAGKKMPNTSIYQSLPDSLTDGIGIYALGKILKKEFQKRNVRIKGVSTPCYVIPSN